MNLTSMILATLLTLTSGTILGDVQGDIYLGSVEGLAPGGGISTNVPGAVTFTFNYRNNDPNKASITNGFEISGSGGINWIGTYGTDPSFPVANFDLGWFENAYSWDGFGADTIGFGGIIITGDGLLPGFDGPAIVLTIDANGAQVGQQICIDSAFYRPAGIWRWNNYSSGDPNTPTWDGPHCYEVVNSTCCYTRGDTDHSGGTTPVHVQDLVYLVDFMFLGGSEPPCMLEADMDGSGGLDVSDLTYIVEFMFLGGPAPVACP